jgi:hypothetical protein
VIIVVLIPSEEGLGFGFLMGHTRKALRQDGIRRGGLAQRIRTALEMERDRLQKQEYRRQKREELQARQVRDEDDSRRRVRCNFVGERVNVRQVRCDANAILEVVSSTLGKTVDLQHQAAVLQTVWSDPVMAAYLSESFRLSAQVKAQKEVIAGLVRSLSEVKNARSKAELATKHAILIAAVSSVPSMSSREKAHLLGVHPRNVRVVVQRRGAMDSIKDIAWILSVRRQRWDITSESVKAVVTTWWVSETRASPNRKEVVKKWIAPGKHEKHHTQYLLESQA